MAEVKLFRIVLILGIVGGMIGAFFDKIQWGFIIGLAIGSVYIAVKRQKNTSDEG